MTCQAEDVNIKKASLGEMIHFNCEFPNNMSRHSNVIFRFLKKEKDKNIVTDCRILIEFKRTTCEFSGGDPDYKWGIFYEGDNLAAIEVIKEILSPNDAGEYECSMETWGLDRRPEKKCIEPCFNEFTSSPTVLSIIPPTFPTPMVDFKIFNETILNCDGNPIFGCISRADEYGGTEMYVSRAGLPIMHGEIIPLWDEREQFSWKCCFGSNCTDIKLFSTNASSLNKFLAPLTDVKTGELEMKSLKIRAKLDHEVCGVSTPNLRNTLKGYRTCIPDSYLILITVVLFVMLNLELAVYREGLRYWRSLETRRASNEGSA